MAGTAYRDTAMPCRCSRIIHGTAAAPAVVRVTATPFSENDRPVMCAHYEFTGSRGRFVKGRWKTVDPPVPGTEIWMIYDPKNPRRSVPA
ncbi:MAG: hypothetical protein JXA20_03065 [Spirochaetes bacterium]|nr:hypothetical protein [Spirochaetota bacterium]